MGLQIWLATMKKPPKSRPLRCSLRKESTVAVASRSSSRVRVAQLTCRDGAAKNNPSSHRVPVKSRALSGVDSLYSIVQMPGGVPVATMAIGGCRCDKRSPLCPPSSFSRGIRLLRQRWRISQKNKEKSQRSLPMSSSKTIGIIGGGQLGQMMAISAIYMGHKVIAWIQQLIAQPPVWRKSSWLLTTTWMPFVSWLIAVMFSPMNLKMSMLTVWMLLSKKDQLPTRDRPASHFPKSHFERTFFPRRLKSPWLPTRSWPQAKIWQISTCRKLCPQDGDRWLRWPWSEGHSFRSRFGRSLYTLADSADCVLEEFVNFDLENFCHRVWKWQGRDSFPSSGKYPPQQHSSKPLCLLAFQKV